MQVSRDGQSWRIGAAAEVDWIAGHTTAGVSITTAIPPIFDAYATTYQADDVTAAAYEHALIKNLITPTPDQPWWLAYLDTGAHDVVFPTPRGCSSTGTGRTFWSRPAPSRPSPGAPVVTYATRGA
ncbi:hypothetical protein ACIBJE_19855 [Micromonospora sp. NPDC050187]|uniref:hypothetical protein n=1 Tax=Micromonospora sp. NPDC050187 TaxID=3364277 RepID=UPI0037AF054D